MLVAIAVWLGFAMTDPAAIPPEWVTVLHENGGRGNLSQLAHGQAHAGPNHRALVTALTGSDSLRSGVATHVAFSLTGGALFLALARTWSGHLAIAAAWTALYLGVPVLWDATFSEVPASLLGLYHVAGAAALAVWAAGEDRLLAGTVLGLLTALVLATRVEVAAIGLVVGALCAAQVFAGPQIHAAFGRASDGLRRWLLESRGAGRWLVVAGVVLVSVGLEPAAQDLGKWVWFVAGINPLKPSFLVLPLVLVTYLPVGVVALFLLGVVHLARRGWGPLGAVIALFVLYRIYHQACHGAVHEMRRYCSYFLPVALMMAVFGQAELEAWARRWSWPAGWRFPASLTLILLMLVPTRPRTSPATDGSDVWFRLTTLQQEEVRFGLQVRERWPHCALVSRVTRQNHGTRGKAWDWLWIVNRHPGVVVEPAEQPLDQLVRQSHETCILYFEGQDCFLVNAPDACNADRPGGLPLATRRVVGGQYNDMDERGLNAADVMLAVYALRGP